MKKKNFVLFGAAGYVAPKHLKAIKDTNNNLVACFDVSDSVGILDKYFPNSLFFNQEEKIIKFIENKNLNKKTKIDYLSLCTPNYLHDSQIRLGLRLGLDVICEKPICINPKNIQLIKKIEIVSKKKCFPILQLRLHPKIILLKTKVKNIKNLKGSLVYIAPRGKWYHQSWKGDSSKSGGIETNIGIHFFDMLIFLFGKSNIFKIHHRDAERSHGILKFKNATIEWFLSINKNDLKNFSKDNNSFRCLNLNKEKIDFSYGFDDLHTKMYQNILNEKGFGIEDAEEAIKLVDKIRNKKIIGKKKYLNFIKNLVNEKK